MRSYSNGNTCSGIFIRWSETGELQQHQAPLSYQRSLAIIQRVWCGETSSILSRGHVFKPSASAKSFSSIKISCWCERMIPMLTLTSPSHFPPIQLALCSLHPSFLLSLLPFQVVSYSLHSLFPVILFYHVHTSPVSVHFPAWVCSVCPTNYSIYPCLHVCIYFWVLFTLSSSC